MEGPMNVGVSLAAECLIEEVLAYLIARETEMEPLVPTDDVVPVEEALVVD